MAAGSLNNGPDRAKPLVKDIHTGQRLSHGRNRSWPPNLDPADEIHPFSLTAHFCK
jgi:hypothetical protein